MNKPKNKRVRPKTLREVVRDGLARDCAGLCLDDSGDLDLAAEAIESLVWDYFDDPGPTHKYPSTPHKAPAVRDETAEHDPWEVLPDDPELWVGGCATPGTDYKA